MEAIVEKAWILAFTRWATISTLVSQMELRTTAGIWKHIGRGTPLYMSKDMKAYCNQHLEVEKTDSQCICFKKGDTFSHQLTLIITGPQFPSCFQGQPNVECIIVSQTML